MTDVSSSRPPPLPQAGMSRAIPPPLPMPALNYHRPGLVQTGNEKWVTLTFLTTASQWHETRAALARAHIECMMGEGEDAAALDRKGRSTHGIALLVPQSQIARAAKIYEAMKAGHEWCAKCGSTDLRALPVSWWWWAFSLLFIGVAPYSPPRWECGQCGHKWE
jgi:ribosomal protein S27AE